MNDSTFFKLIPWDKQTKTTINYGNLATPESGDIMRFAQNRDIDTDYAEELAGQIELTKILFPIIVVWKNEKLVILDGTHRHFALLLLSDKLQTQIPLPYIELKPDEENKSDEKCYQKIVQLNSLSNKWTLKQNIASRIKMKDSLAILLKDLYDGHNHRLRYNIMLSWFKNNYQETNYWHQWLSTQPISTKKNPVEPSKISGLEALYKAIQSITESIETDPSGKPAKLPEIANALVSIAISNKNYGFPFDSEQIKLIRQMIIKIKIHSPKNGSATVLKWLNNKTNDIENITIPMYTKTGAWRKLFEMILSDEYKNWYEEKI